MYYNFTGSQKDYPYADLGALRLLTAHSIINPWFFIILRPSVLRFMWRKLHNPQKTTFMWRKKLSDTKETGEKPRCAASEGGVQGWRWDWRFATSAPSHKRRRFSSRCIYDAVSCFLESCLVKQLTSSGAVIMEVKKTPQISVCVWNILPHKNKCVRKLMNANLWKNHNLDEIVFRIFSSILFLLSEMIMKIVLYPCLQPTKRMKITWNRRTVQKMQSIISHQ